MNHSHEEQDKDIHSDAMVTLVAWGLPIADSLDLRPAQREGPHAGTIKLVICP